MQKTQAGEVALDRSVQERLFRLDPNLYATFSRFILDPETHAPVLYEETREPVVDPHWYLWRRCNDGMTRLVSLYPKLGHEEVRGLEGDLFGPAVRGTKSIDEILELVAHARERVKQRGHAVLRDLQRDKIAANEKRIHDLLFEGKDGTRDAKAFSAPGLTQRATPGRIAMDAKEDGWELPEESS